MLFVTCLIVALPPPPLLSSQIVVSDINLHSHHQNHRLYILLYWLRFQMCHHPVYRATQSLPPPRLGSRFKYVSISKIGGDYLDVRCVTSILVAIQRTKVELLSANTSSVLMLDWTL